MRSRVLGVLFVLILVGAAIFLNFRRGPSPVQIAAVPTQGIPQTVAGAPTNVVVSAPMQTNFYIDQFLLDDGLGGYREDSPSEFPPSVRGQPHDLIDFHAAPPAISLK